MWVEPPNTWAAVPAAVRAALAAPLTKRGDDGTPVLSPAADVLGWRAGDLNAHWGGPRPLANLLVGSALGALGGWGVGRLAEEVLPERYFKPGGMRRRGAILGGLAGAAFPLYQAFDNVRVTGRPESVAETWPPKEGAARTWADPIKPFLGEKEAVDLFAPVIDRDGVNRLAWGDPHLPPPLRAATSGLYEAASSVSGGDLISPWDVGKIAVGAGAGLVSGVIAGKALGLLCGLTPEAQRGVQNAGLAAGILRATIPPALGLR